MLSIAVYQNLRAAPKSHISAFGHAAFVKDLSLHYIQPVQHRVVLSVIQIHTYLSEMHTHTHTFTNVIRSACFAQSLWVTAGREGWMDGWMDGGINDKLSPLI